ncbi:MAG: phosphate signaling complex protein PhoU [Haloferacaceae archaeon]
MPRDGYQAELDDLRAGVLDLGETVADQLESGVDAVDRGDDGLARSVVDRDAAVNDRYLDLEQDCIDLFALQQPVAGDLRFVASSFKILTDIERIGDLAANLGGYALDADPDRFPGVDVRGIGSAVLAQVEAALGAYASADADACRDVAARDDEVDAVCGRATERVVRELIEREGTAGPWTVERLIDDVSRALLVVRDLERVGDHAVNVAARTLYVVETDPELIY